MLLLNCISIDPSNPSSVIDYNVDSNCRVIIIGWLCIIQAYGMRMNGNNNWHLGDLPEGLTPYASFDGALNGDTTNNTGNLWVNSFGGIYCHNNSAANDTFSGQLIAIVF